MIEAMLVLIVLAVLTAVVVSRHSGRQTAAWAEAEIVKSHLRYVQALATAYNTSEWSVLFGGNSYSLLQNGNPSPIPIPGSASPVRNLTDGVTITSGAGAITFDENGSPGDADRTIVLNGICSIRVTGGTGLVP